MTRLIDADALWTSIIQSRKETIIDDDVKISMGEFVKLLDNAPTVKVPENEVNCVLTMFGDCSYNETGCSDCEIKEKIRKRI